MDQIKIMGQYYIEIWKALGMDQTNVKFLWASEEISKNGDNYWPIVFDIAKKNTVARIKKCATIMGKQEKEEDASGAMIFYPCM